MLGIALGPGMTGVLSTDVLGYFDTVVSVSLAMLGVFVGLGLGAIRAPDAARLLAVALLEIGMTIAVVAGAMNFLLTRWSVPLPIDPALFALVLGVCSGASAAVGLAGAARDVVLAARVADLDDVPLIGLGSVLLVMTSTQSSYLDVVLTAGAGAGVGLAGWILFERAHGEAERGVFVTGAIVLLGGVAAYVGGSPLLSGCTAALFWVHAPGAADRIIEQDLRKLQHPLVALLLIVAGALIEWSMALLWIAAPLVLFRLTGKLLASAAAAGLMRTPPSILATVLVPPGVIGIALALNLQQQLPTESTLLVSSITVAAVVSEVLAITLLGGTEQSS
jgi:hypothetical protein